MLKFVILSLCTVAVFANVDLGLPQVTVTVNEKSVDMRGSVLTNKYCSASGKKLLGVPYRSQFAPDLDQCLSRCNRDLLCMSADFTTEKICNLHKGRMLNNDVSQLGVDGGTHYHRRLKVEKDCPSGTTPHVRTRTAYSTTFCKIADKKCPSHDLYRKGQNLGDMTKCMEKCAKIKSCASADYINNKCAPKDDKCSAADLVEESGATYLLRLAKSESECPAGSTTADDKSSEPDTPDVTQPEPVVEKPATLDLTQPEPVVEKPETIIGKHYFWPMYDALSDSIKLLKRNSLSRETVDVSILPISNYVEDESLIRQMLRNLRAWYGIDAVREYLVDGSFGKGYFDYYKDYYGY